MSFFGVFLSSVPKLFWSEYSGKPFLKCIGCKIPLMESNMHVVKKRIVGGEAVFEMAMCNGCQEKQAKEMSEETRKNITAYMAKQFQQQAAKHLPDDGEEHVIEIAHVENEEEGQALLNRCTDKCMICEVDRSECHRYSIAGMCQDANLVVQVTPVVQTPFMVCEKCEMQMSELVSQETRDSWDRFVQENFDGPPGVEIDSPDHYPMAF